MPRKKKIFLGPQEIYSSRSSHSSLLPTHQDASFNAKDSQLMHRFILLLLFFAVPLLCAAQELAVLDLESSKPISGVLVSAKNPKISSQTDLEGKLKLADFVGNKVISLSKEGYQSQTLSWKELENLGFLVYLIPSPFTLETTVISASRWNQTTKDIPGKVRQLDSKWLDLRNPATTADWLGSSGEVVVQKSQLGGGSPMIRGFSANRLLYSVDGVRMNTAIFRSGNLQQILSLDPFSLKSTEILFGPGAVLYGSDAIGGVMVFETLRPDPEVKGLRGNIVTRFSSAYSEETIHGDFRYGKGKWSFLSSGTYFQFGDLTMGKNKGQPSYLRNTLIQQVNGQDLEVPNLNPRKQLQTGYRQVNLMQKINFQATKNTTLEYGFHYSTTSDIPRYDRLIEKRDGKLRFARWDYGPQRWMLQQVNLNLKAATRFYDQAKVIAAYQLFEESRIDRRVGSVTEFRRTENVRAYSLNADFYKIIKANHFFNYGIEGVINTVRSAGVATNLLSRVQEPASSRYPKSTWTSWALYGTYNTQLSSHWKMQSALRYNLNGIETDFSQNLAFYPVPVTSYSDRYPSLTGNLGFVYQPSPSFSIAPQLATGFRAPNVDDMGKIFDSEPGAVLVPNANLAPEYAYNAELNLNKSLHGKLKMDLTGYYTWLDKAMVRRPFTLNGQSQLLYDGELSQILAIQNAAFAKIAGIQAGLELILPKGLLLSSKYNWQKGVEELDDQSSSPSRHAAPAFGMSKLRYEGKKGTLEFSAQYSAAMPFDRMPQEELAKVDLYATDAQGNPYSPSWLIFNVAARLDLSPHFQLNLGIENLSNQQYRGYSSGIVSPGRNFQVSVKGTF